MSVICENERGEVFVFTKGAADVIIENAADIHLKRNCGFG